MKRLLANGVTTMRGMFEAPSHLTLRGRVARGEVLGPTIFAAGPIFHGSRILSTADAVQRRPDDSGPEDRRLRPH